MAQLLLIKDANTAAKTVGDIVGIYDDSHMFSETEKDYFNILQIEGERLEIKLKLFSFRYDIQTALKSETTRWTLDKPERKEVWKDSDDKWCWLGADPKYKYSIAQLTEAEKRTLIEDSLGVAKEAVLKRMVVNPGTWDEKNIVEAMDLNG